jgi:hypothetical protein
MSSMSIVGAQNLSFLHIPRNAGESINKWLREIEGEHIQKTGAREAINTWTEVENHPRLSAFRTNHPTNYTFTIVRNPWDRAVSLYYNFTQIATEEQRRAAMAAMGWTTMLSFEESVINHSEIVTLEWENEIHKSQSSWIDDSIDLVVKLENLEVDIQPIRDLFGGATLALPRENVTTRDSDYRRYYNTNTQNIIAELFAEDIDRWGYTF